MALKPFSFKSTEDEKNSSNVENQQAPRIGPKTDHSQVMRIRWESVIKFLPNTDKIDIVSENYVLNNGVSKTYKR